MPRGAENSWRARGLSLYRVRKPRDRIFGPIFVPYFVALIVSDPLPVSLGFVRVVEARVLLGVVGAVGGRGCVVREATWSESLLQHTSCSDPVSTFVWKAPG
jgi:hypothetical protein